MGEILLALAQFFVEALFPVLLESLISLLIPSVRTGFQKADTYISLAGIGLLLGGVAGYFVPSPFGNNIAVQAFAVMFGPVLAGLAVSRIAQTRAKRESAPTLFSTGWMVYWFCFTFLLARSVVIHNNSVRYWP